MNTYPQSPGSAPAGSPTYPAPGAMPGGPGSPQPTPSGPGHGPKRNNVSLVALIAAILGFIFAVWEGAYIIGWVLLPIAFILSLVGLFARGASKKMAVAALIISIVGTIVGMVAFLGSVGEAVDDALGGTEATPVASAPSQPEPVDEPEPDNAATEDATPDASPEAAVEPEQTDDEPAASEPPAAEASPDGTRGNPFPLGTTVANDDWELTVNSVVLDATAEVVAENMFNDDPAAGNVYRMVNVTATYVGEESGSTFELRFHYVTQSGNVIADYDTFVVGPDELDTAELYSGASTSGNVVFEVPDGDEGTVRIALGLFSDEVFFALA